MRTHLLPIVALLTSTFLLMVGAGLIGIVLLVRGSIEGWSAFEIGLLGTGYAEPTSALDLKLQYRVMGSAHGTDPDIR